MLSCNQTKLHFEIQSQYGKRIVYHDDKTMLEMTNPNFWISAVRAKRLRVTDRICIMRVEYESAQGSDVKKVIEARDFIVAAINKDHVVRFIDPSYPPEIAGKKPNKAESLRERVKEKAA